MFWSVVPQSMQAICPPFWAAFSDLKVGIRVTLSEIIELPRSTPPPDFALTQTQDQGRSFAHWHAIERTATAGRGWRAAIHRRPVGPDQAVLGCASTGGDRAGYLVDRAQ